MSISYLTSPNDYNLHCKSLSASDSLSTKNFSPDSIDTNTITVNSIALTNKKSLSLGLWGNTSFGWVEIVPPIINITYRIVDKLIFIEFPVITASLPSGINQLAISDEVFSSPSIAWGFLFKYDTNNIVLGSVNSGADEFLLASLLNSLNTAIFLNRTSPFSAGVFNLYPTVITLILA